MVCPCRSLHAVWFVCVADDILCIVVETEAGGVRESHNSSLGRLRVRTSSRLEKNCLLLEGGWFTMRIACPCAFSPFPCSDLVRFQTKLKRQQSLGPRFIHRTNHQRRTCNHNTFAHDGMPPLSRWELELATIFVGGFVLLSTVDILYNADLQYRRQPPFVHYCQCRYEDSSDRDKPIVDHEPCSHWVVSKQHG